MTPPPFHRDQIVDFPLSDVDLSDTTYRFRDQLRLPKLKHSIATDGVQVPVLLRPQGSGYQLIAGFRRCTAATEVGLETVPAIIREMSDDAALRACLLENTERKSYSPLDLAVVIRRHEEFGKTQREIGAIIGLKDRQIRNIKELLDLPRVLRDAIADEDQYFSATHGIALRALAHKYDHTSSKQVTKFVRPWIAIVNADHLSVQKLTRRVNAQYGSPAGESFQGILAGSPSDERVRLKPVVLDFRSLPPESRAVIRTQLEDLIRRLDSTTDD